jgi:hypothetical protein
MSLNQTLRLEFHSEGLHELIGIMVVFLSDLKTSTKSNYYEAYILRQLYDKLRRKEDQLLISGSRYAKVKIDNIQALVLHEVLSGYQTSINLSPVVVALGRILPNFLKQN